MPCNIEMWKDVLSNNEETVNPRTQGCLECTHLHTEMHAIYLVLDCLILNIGIMDHIFVLHNLISPAYFTIINNARNIILQKDMT